MMQLLVRNGLFAFYLTTLESKLMKATTVEKRHHIQLLHHRLFPIQSIRRKFEL